MERSSFFDAILDQEGNPDRNYLAEDYARFFASFIGNGVFPNPSTNLQVVVNNDMTIVIKQGKAWINGYFYENTDDLILQIEPADGVLSRIDRITLRLDFQEREIRAYIKQGEFASNAVAKELQRDADAYEIALADIEVSKGVIAIMQANITDLRLNKDLCGIVHGVVDQVDTTSIFSQYLSWYEQTTDQAEIDIDEIKQKFQSDINDFWGQWVQWFNMTTQAKEQEFDDWFNNIKGQLDDDLGARLVNRVDTIGDNIGIIDDLTTEDKSNIVNAINEINAKEVDLKPVEELLNTHTSANITAHNVSRGTSNFAGNNQEVTIPHGLSVVPTSAYAFPMANPEGYLGEVWIRMDATNLYVGNSGSFTGAMSWTAIG